MKSLGKTIRKAYYFDEPSKQCAEEVIEAVEDTILGIEEAASSNLNELGILLT